MNDVLEKIEKSLESITNKDVTFYFFMPNVQSPNSSVYEIYVNANYIKQMGYKPIIIVNDDFEKPYWIESTLLDLPHQKPDGSLVVRPEDFMIIPEIYTNVMEQTYKNKVSGTRIVLAQSYDYAMNGLLPSMTWKHFGINDVIVQTDNMLGKVKTVLGDYDVQKYRIGIPDYFKPDDKPKRPTIGFLTRNANTLNRVVKEFILLYPHYANFVSFEHLSNLSREELASKLSKHFAAIWIDDIATFGTFPLECMKSGTIPIAKLPDMGTTEFIVDNTGVWTPDTNSMPKMIGEMVGRYLENGVPDILYDTMKRVSSEYSVENSHKDLNKVYNYFITKRINQLNSAKKEILEREKQLEKEKNNVESKTEKV